LPGRHRGVRRISGLPTINALTDDEHPCQILADIFTFQEKRGSIEGKVVTFVGDGASNTARSWMFAAGRMNFELRLASPRKYQPSAEWLKRTAEMWFAMQTSGSRARRRRFYTDIWVSWARKAKKPGARRNLGPIGSTRIW